jgi:uncharacterized radical SAM superfamily Fe-S cluster-containing enzyme
LKTIKSTRSLCPQCLKVIEATIYEDGGKVYLGKECPEHGKCVELYWSDFGEYTRAQKYATVGSGPENPQTKVLHGHPFDCGLCPNHKSATSLAIIDVTNRCNLRCPICFANANVTGSVYEPTQSQIRSMLKTLRSTKPLPPAALQFSGGEPTVREDLIDLVQMANEEGFDHVEVNTNGIRLAESVDYCKQLADAGVSTVYLQFDGLRPEIYISTRGLPLLETKLKAIENCRKAGLHSIVLVPTIVRGVNDDQLGAIVNFAAQNSDLVRCVNFQPVSITGRISYEKRQEMRITIPDCTRLIEEQTQGMIKVSDFYPVPVVVPVARAIGALKGRHYPEFTVHEHCGMATFLLKNGENFVPITRFADIDKFMDAMDDVYKTAKEGANRRAQFKLLSATLKNVKLGLMKQLVGAVFKEGSYDSLGNFMRNILMVGMMHFQDPYNFDLERLERCGIHYATPDGRIIPFCAMNTLYRPLIEKQFSIPLKEWLGNNQKEKTT